MADSYISAALTCTILLLFNRYVKFKFHTNYLYSPRIILGSLFSKEAVLGDGSRDGSGGSSRE